MRIRLAGIDGPLPATATAPAECGAPQAAAALRKYVKRYRQDVGVRYLRAGKRRLADPDGRLLADVQYGGNRGTGSLGDDLVVGGWAQVGVRLGAPTAEVKAGAAFSELPGDDVMYAPGLRGRGVWAICGGRFHLPGDAAPPPYRPAVWSIDTGGITRSIGGFPLPASAGRGPTLPVKQIVDQFGPADVVHDEFGCTVSLPSAQLVVGTISDEAAQRTPSCENAAVFMIWSHGPEVVNTDRGAQTGMTAKQVSPFFPELEPDRMLTEDYFPLDARDGRTLDWPTAIWTFDNDKITAFTTTFTTIYRPSE